jgi:hypothetical protein
MLILQHQILIEQNRCAMACQGFGAVLLYLKKQWKHLPLFGIV